MFKYETGVGDCIGGLRMTISEGVVGLATIDPYKLDQDAEGSS